LLVFSYNDGFLDAFEGVLRTVIVARFSESKARGGVKVFKLFLC